ncbi:PaREP1 family protein [Candidatus Bathyarchaeota archaeon]|nr:PaREP1 family protein [Candidatus Bathyarchaeota archaeon]
MSIQVFVPEAALRELRRKAEERGISLSEYLLEIAVGDLDPSVLFRRYIEGALDLIHQARLEFERGDLRQASEKIWGACALAIKSHALYERGRKIESHADLWKYKDEVVRELGEWVRTAFMKADSMHKNFYENLATNEDVKDVLEEVNKLVSTLSEKLSGKDA